MLEAKVPFLYFTSNGLQTNFPFDWLVLTTSDIAVYVDLSLALSGYTVTGLGDEDGGSVVFFNPPAAGSKIILRRITPRTQPTDLLLGGLLPSPAMEATFDRVVMLVQDLAEMLTLVPRFAPTVIEAFRTALLPTPTPLKMLGFDALGTGWTLYDPALVTITVDPVSGRVAGKTTVVVPSVDDAGQLTAAGVWPAGVLGLGMTVRVTTAFGNTRGLTGFHLGLAGEENLWATNQPRTVGASNAGQWTNYRQHPCPGAVNALLTAVDGNYDNVGEAKVTGHWETYAPDA